MCLYCGCHMAHADPRNAANVSFESVEAAAEANDMGVAESPEMMGSPMRWPPAAAAKCSMTPRVIEGSKSDVKPDRAVSDRRTGS